MKFFLDTAVIDEIRTATAWGMCDGVTTNPSLVAKTGKSLRAVVDEIVAVVDGPISVEATATDYEGLVSQARTIAKTHENIVVKIPMTTDGLRAVRTVSGEGIATNVTLVFTPVQALMAAKAGATYVSPFIGRIDDIGATGIEIVEHIHQIFQNYDLETEVIVASVRNPVHVLQAALIGADIATIPFPVLKQLFQHPLTDLGIEKFLADWQKVPKA